MSMLCVLVYLSVVVLEYSVLRIHDSGHHVFDIDVIYPVVECDLVEDGAAVERVVLPERCAALQPVSPLPLLAIRVEWG